MNGTRYYRGGSDLTPRPNDIKTDSITGLLSPSHGVSVESVPDGLERFGGAYEITNLPSNLRIVQKGRRATHHEIVPVHSMTEAEYRDALAQVVLIPVTPSGAKDGSST